MDAGLFIHLPRDPGQNIYFKVFDGQDTASPPTPLRINCSSSYKKRDQYKPFPTSTDCHTSHIAMPHGLWPSMVKEYRLPLFYITV